MSSVLSILNLLLEHLHFTFSDLGKQLRPTSAAAPTRSDPHHTKYIEQLFLANFPYHLAENFEYTASDSKKTPANQRWVIAILKKSITNYITNYFYTK
jgi:hypothetical protein